MEEAEAIEAMRAKIWQEKCYSLLGQTSLKRREICVREASL
jgi:hypothetical protein